MASLAQQLAPGSPSLVIHGSADGFVVSSDGVWLTAPAPWDEASAALRELRATRVFAAETLRHLLSKPSQTEA
jgi:hypothetical protein